MNGNFKKIIGFFFTKDTYVQWMYILIAKKGYWVIKFMILFQIVHYDKLL